MGEFHGHGTTLHAIKQLHCVAPPTEEANTPANTGYSYWSFACVNNVEDNDLWIDASCAWLNNEPMPYACAALKAGCSRGKPQRYHDGRDCSQRRKPVREGVDQLPLSFAETEED